MPLPESFAKSPQNSLDILRRSPPATGEPTLEAGDERLSSLEVIARQACRREQEDPHGFRGSIEVDALEHQVDSCGSSRSQIFLECIEKLVEHRFGAFSPRVGEIDFLQERVYLLRFVSR